MAREIPGSLGLNARASSLAHFLAWADRDAGGRRRGFTRAELIQFFASPGMTQLAATTRRGVLVALKMYYRHIEETIPYVKVVGPRRHEMVRPSLSREEIRSLILTTRQGRQGPEAAALIALSTTYGFRRIELSRVEMVSADALQVQAAKRGPIRKHLIPKSIKPYLAGYVPDRGASDLSAMFQRIRREAGLAPVDRLGWHSIRRALDTGLTLNGAARELRQAFIGWEFSTSDSASHYLAMDWRDIDRAISRAHPFIEFWRQ